MECVRHVQRLKRDQVLTLLLQDCSATQLAFKKAPQLFNHFQCRVFTLNFSKSFEQTSQFAPMFLRQFRANVTLPVDKTTLHYCVCKEFLTLIATHRYHQELPTPLFFPFAYAD